MGFILSILAYILFALVAFINFPIVMVKYAGVRGFWKTLNKYWLQNAIALDVFGNYSYRTTWNLLFKKNNGYAFGNQNETISSALGKNQRDNTLSFFGKIMCWILDILEKNHCKNAIKNYDSKTY